MSGASEVRPIVELMKALRRTVRLASVVPTRLGPGAVAAAGSQQGRRSERGEHSNAVRLTMGAGSLAIALLAADTFNEKRFFKAAQHGNIQELHRQIEALRVNEGQQTGSKEESGVNRRHTLGWTALMTAAANDQPKAVQELLKMGAKPDLAEK